MARKICKDPKHIAWATWTILANNPVNKSFYLLLQIVDGAIQMIYILILLSRMHYQNMTQELLVNQSTSGLNSSNIGASSSSQVNQSSYYMDYHYDSPGISYKVIKSLDDYFIQQTHYSQNMLWMALTLGVLGISLGILLAIFLYAVLIKDHVGLHKSDYLKKALCLLMVLKMTIFQLPFCDVILRFLFTTGDPAVSLQIQVVKYGLGVLSMLLFSAVMLYIVRLFNVCVPTVSIPWCYPVSNLVYLNLAMKFAIVICIVLDPDGLYVLIEVVVVFIIQIVQSAYRLLFSPNYEPMVDFVVKSRDFILALSLVIGLGCRIVEDKKNYDLIYMICFAPIITLGWKILESMRNQQILVKLKTKTLKLELEYEYILYTLMQLIATTQKESLMTQRVFGQLMDIMLVHINDCDDQLCICDEMENFYELMRYKYFNNSEIFSLEREERTKYKKIIDDQGLVGTISNLTDITIKSHSSESTQLKANNEMERANMLQEESDLLEKNNMRSAHNREVNGEGETHDVSNSGKTGKKKKRRTYKINIDEIKFRFLSELIYLFYFELKQKFPDSFKIQLLSNYFALRYKKKDMLCIFQLRSFNIQKLSLLNRITFIINERFLLNEIEIDQRSQQIINSENGQAYNMNGEYFIKINQLYKNFNICIESLSSSVVNFWKDFQKETINVEKLQTEGITIARNIMDTFKVFQDLDTIKLFKDYQMYFQFALVQLHILNDQVAYELYINKMKSILETNKMFEKNFSSEKDSDYSNFIIVDANGNKFGQILQINNSLRHLLEWNESDFSRYRIESIMPTLIKEKHSVFLDRYNKTGQSFIINNKTCMFIKKSNGFVIPIELYIKFHYSIQYQYVFLAILKPFYEISPFSNGVKYNIDQLIFVITDSEDGRIFEYSESCRQILRFSKTYTGDGIIKRVDELIDGFNFKEFKKSRHIRYMNNDIYEEVHNLDLAQLNDVTDIDIDKTMFNFLNSNMFDKLSRSRTRIFEERYSGGVLDINIFCFLLLQEGEDGTISQTAMTQQNLMFSNTLQAYQQLNHIGPAELDKIQEEHEHSMSQAGDDNHDSSSATGSSLSSTANSSTTSMLDYRNFHSFSHQSTPRSLRIILNLLIILYIIMIVISSVNLGINISRQRQSEYDVNVVKDANNRMNIISINLLLSRVLLNIANGYETNNSTLIPDRFTSYKLLQEKKIDLMRTAQSNLQQSSFINSEALDEILTGQPIQLYYLNDQNKIYSKWENLNIAFNLYIARVADMNTMTRQQMIGKQNIQVLSPTTSSNYKPSPQEESIFFSVENGVKGFRRFATEMVALYSDQSEYHAEQNINSTKVTTIISVITIFIVGTIIAPIFTKAEIRKFKALKYFLKISQDTFPQMIENCEYCLNMNDEVRYDEIMKDYEKFLGLKIRNQQIEQLRKTRDQTANVFNQESRAGGSSSDQNTSYMFGAGILGGGGGSTTSSKYLGSGNIKNKNSFLNPQLLQQQLQLESGRYNRDSIKDLEGASVKLPGNSLQIQAENNSQNQQEYLRQNSDKYADQGPRDGERQQFNLKAMNLHNFKQKKDKEKKRLEKQKEDIERNNERGVTFHNSKQQENSTSLSKRESQVNSRVSDVSKARRSQYLAKPIIKQSDADGSEDDYNNHSHVSRSIIESELSQSQIHLHQIQNEAIQESNEEKVRAKKKQLINQRSYRRRTTMIFLIISVIVLLSLYFVIAYFLAIRTFDAAMQVIQSLQLIFYKGSCFDSTMNFLRESEIRKSPVRLEEYDNASATEYYLGMCLSMEAQYSQLKMNIPDYFESAKDLIKNLDSGNMCDTVYVGEFASLHQMCKSSLNGIFEQGMSNALYYMYAKILKDSLKVNANLVKENVTVLEGLMMDKEVIEIIDVKAKLLDPTLTALQDKCTESVISYIQRLLSDFVIAFIVFVLLLTIGMIILVFVGFKTLRRSMWETNILIKIIPFEAIDKKDRIKIKDFFNS